MAKHTVVKCGEKRLGAGIILTLRNTIVQQVRARKKVSYLERFTCKYHVAGDKVVQRKRSVSIPNDSSHNCTNEHHDFSKINQIIYQVFITTHNTSHHKQRILDRIFYI